MCLGRSEKVKQSDKPFGYSYKKKFKIGDLVTWSWFTSEEGLFRETGFGVLIDFVHYEYGSRQVVFGKVLPYNSTEMVEINITTLKKKETN